MDYRSKTNKEFDKLYLKFVLLLGLLGSYLKYLLKERGEAHNDVTCLYFLRPHPLSSWRCVCVFSTSFFILTKKKSNLGNVLLFNKVKIRLKCILL